MDRPTAESISKLMMEFGARLNDSVELVQKTADPLEFARYRRAVGVIMGEMLLNIMNPLYEGFPDLKPSELE